MANEIIRPSALETERTSPVASEFLVTDNETNVAKVTIEKAVQAGRPAASKNEAEAGSDANKVMTPLTVQQKIDYEIGKSLASKAQGDKADTAIQPNDLGAVATSNDYDDLDNKPTLGTAAAEDVGAFATATQGGKADTAWQPTTVLPSPSLGDWDGATAYQVNDRVFHNGNYWIAKAASTNSEPVEGADWTLFLPGVAVADGSVTEPKLNTSLRSIVGFQYKTLSDFTSDDPPADVSSVRVVERIAGNGGPFRTMEATSEPLDLPALAKFNIMGRWSYMVPEGGIITPEAFGVRGGYILPAYTRAVFDEYLSENIDMHSEYLALVNQVMQRMDRAGILANVDWSIDSGTDRIVFTPDTGALTDPQEHAADYILGRYNRFAEHIFGQGEVVTGAMVNAGDVINVTANTQAMQDFIRYLENGRATGVLDAKTYIVNDTINPQIGVKLIGVKGRSTIRAADNMPFDNPLVMLGGPTTPGRDLTFKGIRFEGNLARMGGSAGSVTGAPAGTVFSTVFCDNVALEDLQIVDGRKHAFDFTGATYNRSGTPGTINPQIDEISTGLSAKRILCEGAGDDCFTTHTCRGFDIEDCVVMFSRGTDTDNSGGFEFDDGSEDGEARNLKARFVNGAVQIKGHSDAAPATRITVKGVDIYKCNNGVMIWHTDHGGSGFTPVEGTEATVLGAKFRHPLAWIAAETVRQALRGYAYKKIEVDVSCIQEGADPDYFETMASSQGAFSLYNGIGEVKGKFYLEGFRECSYGLNATSSSTGPFDIWISGKNGPDRLAREASTGPYILITALAERDGTAGTEAVTGSGDYMKLRESWLFGYTSPASSSLNYP